MAGTDLNRELFDAAEARVRQCLATELAEVRQEGTLRIRDRLEKETSLLRFDLRRLGTTRGRVPSADAQAFRDEIGAEPADVLLRLKMEAARDLLRHRHLKIWQIAGALGYKSQQAFTRGFKAIFAVPPSVMAKELAPAGEDTAPPTELTDDRVWYAATVNALGQGAMRGLTDRLRQVTGDGYGEIVCFESRDTEAESQVAEEIWSMLSPLPACERRHRVEQVVRTDSPAFFELLGKKYRAALHKDSREALELADLALTHLEVNADRLGDVLPSLEALAWAWRGHALHSDVGADGDESEVRQAYRQAWNRWEAEGGQGEARVEARICLYESYFLFAHKRDQQALKRLDRAIVLARVQGLSGLLVDALMQRLLVLTLRQPLEDVAAEADLVLAELQRTGMDPACVFVYGFLAHAFAGAGRHEEARRYRRMSLLEED